MQVRPQYVPSTGNKVTPLDRTWKASLYNQSRTFTTSQCFSLRWTPRKRRTSIVPSTSAGLYDTRTARSLAGPAGGIRRAPAKPAPMNVGFPASAKLGSGGVSASAMTVQSRFMVDTPTICTEAPFKSPCLERWHPILRFHLGRPRPTSGKAAVRHGYDRDYPRFIIPGIASHGIHRARCAESKVQSAGVGPLRWDNR